MIPQRVLKDSYANAVRYRVVACRKRLREVRANQRAQGIGRMDEDATAAERVVAGPPPSQDFIERSFALEVVELQEAEIP